MFDAYLWKFELSARVYNLLSVLKVTETEFLDFSFVCNALLKRDPMCVVFIGYINNATFLCIFGIGVNMGREVMCICLTCCAV